MNRNRGEFVTGMAKWCEKSYIHRVPNYKRHVLNIEGECQPLRL
jgi:hypothetical protein